MPPPEIRSPAPSQEYRSIALLDDGLINQIAAGEVVERPASAVKELIENSLDAGATQIQLYVAEGGINEIRLIDNGCGMTKEDLRLAVQRHATSKIRTATDLEGIATFGFRGEALSSIASIAELEIRTRRPLEPLGHCLKVSFGEVSEISPVGTSPGTTFIVQNLFQRLPARQKFLRASATEFSHVARCFRELALGNAEVEFSLSHNDRPTYRYGATQREKRVREVLRPDWEPFIVTEESDFGFLEAYLSPPHWISDKGDLTFYVNRRPVKNRSLLSAIRNGYQQTLGPHHEPSGAVFLDLRLDWVDVNVHPQKWEVRCYQQEKIYGWLQATLRKALASRQTLHSLDAKITPGYFSPSPLPKENFGPPTRESGFLNHSFDCSGAPATAPSPQTSSFGTKNAEPMILPETLSGFRYLGQTGASYLIGEDDRGLLLFDQHALHEKQTFEKLRNGRPVESLLSQRLLVPKIIAFPKELVEALEKSQESLAILGFDVEAYGDGDIAVHAYPTLVDETKLPVLLKATVEQLLENPALAREGIEQAYRRIFATWACHGSVRAGQRLSEIEARALIERLTEIDEGWTCPHGRPVIFRMTWDFLGKQFERGKG